VSGGYLDKNTANTSLDIEKRLNRIVKIGTGLEIKHTKMFEYLNASVLEKSENTLRLTTKESIKETFIFPGDNVSINCSNTYDLFAISGKIKNINSLNPLDLTITTTSIERLKDSRKYERYYVSLMANLNSPDFFDRVFVVVKNMSSGGIKFNCSEYLSMTDNVAVEVILDRTNRLSFRGAIVRRSKCKSYFEYGIEIREISESNYECLKHYLNYLASD